MSKGKLILLVVFLALLIIPPGCRRGGSGSNEAFVIALGDNVRTIDPIGATSVEAASERVRVLMFDTQAQQWRP